MLARTPSVLASWLATAAIGLCVPALAAGHSASPGSPAAAGTPTVERHVLDNGLEVLLMPEAGHTVASVQLWYRVGSRDEDEETRGFAHLLELLMYTGTDSISGCEREIHRLGGQFGSATWPDVTLFYTDLPSAHVRRVLEIEADRMRGLQLDEEVVQATVQSIAFKLTRLVQSSPQHFLEDRMRALAYGEHPYANAPIGSPGSVTPVTAGDVRSFYERFYRPDNACLVIAGGIDPAAVLTAARSTLGAVPSSATAPSVRASMPPVPEAGAPETRRDRLDLGFGIPTLAIAYPLPGLADDELTNSSLRLLVGYLEGPGREIWTENLVDEQSRPEVAQIEVDLLVDQYAGLLVVSAALVHAQFAADVERKLSASLSAIGDHIRSLESSDLAASELEEIRAADLHQQYAARVTTSARASALGSTHLLQGNHERFGHERAALSAVTWADIARVAGYLQPGKAVVVELNAEL